MKLITLINGTFEDQKALYNLDTKEVLCTGDYYHNKITERIEGIIQGIKYCGIQVEEDERLIFPNDDLFGVCDFIDESY